MNIIVSPFGKESYYFRSDSTFIRAISDYYIPDFVEEVSVTPILAFRIGRAGKSIREKFAYRYFGPFTYGLLLNFRISDVYTEYRDFMENSMDYSTIVPKDLIELDRYISLLSQDRPLTYAINGLERFRMEKNVPINELYPKFCRISTFCSVRTGDFIAYELGDPIPVHREEHVTGTFGVEKVIDLVIR